jgi:hypothetical protein
MVLDIESRDEAGSNYISPFKLLTTKIQEAIQRRANAAFEVL